MKILFYCQHVLGIGHFFRSMAIAQALQQHHVLFVEGGEPLAAFTPPPHVQRAFLPSLMMDPEFQQLQTGGDDLEQIKTRRRQLLLDRFHGFAPDIVLIELFPFGRKRFRFELLPLLEQIRTRHPQVKVVCSLRDILVEKADQAGYEQKVLKVLNTYFDMLLVHSDPRLIRLEETFSRVRDIRIPIRYTGFVVKNAAPAPGHPDPKRIVASSGGGKVGIRLLSATLQAVQTLTDPALRLRVFIGPFMADADQDALQALAEQDPRSQVLPFAADFPSELSRAGLSVSMAGYNTCMDILLTRTKGLVYPFPQNREQTLRAEKLATQGLLHVLRTLEPASLAAAIQTSLQAPAPPAQMPLDLDGARNTACLIAKHFSTY